METRSHRHPVGAAVDYMDNDSPRPGVIARHEGYSDDGVPRYCVDVMLPGGEYPLLATEDELLRGSDLSAIVDMLTDSELEHTTACLRRDLRAALDEKERRGLPPF